MPAADTRDQRIPLMLSADELEEIEDWRYRQRVPSRSEALRRLIALGLEASSGGPKKPTAPKPPSPSTRGRGAPRRSGRAEAMAPDYAA